MSIEGAFLFRLSGKDMPSFFKCLKKLKSTNYYLEMDSNEFYENLESETAYPFFKQEMKKIIKRHLKTNSISIVLNKNIGVSKTAKYLGIWKGLAKNNIVFLEKEKELENLNILSAIAFLHENELDYLFENYDWLVVIGNKEKIKKDYYQNPFNLDSLKEQLVIDKCIILQFMDLGSDGKIISFLKQDIKKPKIKK